MPRCECEILFWWQSRTDPRFARALWLHSTARPSWIFYFCSPSAEQLLPLFGVTRYLGKSNPRIRRHSKAWRRSVAKERWREGGRDRTLAADLIAKMCSAASPSSVDQGNHAAASLNFLPSFLILSGHPKNVGVRVRQWPSVFGTLHI